MARVCEWIIVHPDQSDYSVFNGRHLHKGHVLIICQEPECIYGGAASFFVEAVSDLSLITTRSGSERTKFQISTNALEVRFMDSSWVSLKILSRLFKSSKNKSNSRNVCQMQHSGGWMDVLIVFRSWLLEAMMPIVCEIFYESVIVPQSPRQLNFIMLSKSYSHVFPKQGDIFEMTPCWGEGEGK